MKSIILLSATTMLAGQVPTGSAKRVFQSQSSTVAYSVEGASEAVEITNVTYELVGPGVPGRPMAERLVLRETTRTRQIVGEVGLEATTSVAAWPLGVDLVQKPLYSMMVSGVDAKTLNGEVFVIARGLEQVEWWSVYKLGSGEHLFDTHVPLAHFSTSRDSRVPRYAGLEVPPDDASDERLKAPNVVGVLTYASPERILGEALVTANDPKRARLLRSYADSTRTLGFAGGRITLSISQNYPLPQSTVSVAVPIVRDALDVGRSQSPAGIQVTAWQRR